MRKSCISKSCWLFCVDVCIVFFLLTKRNWWYTCVVKYKQVLYMATKLGRPAGAEGPRTSLLAVRVTPKLRFGLEMLSRLRNTPVPDLVTRAISDLFGSEHQGLWDHPPGRTPVSKGEPDAPRYLLDALWAEKASDRLANIALKSSHLLNMGERSLWIYVSTDSKYWSHKTKRAESELRRDVLQADWEELKLKFLQVG